MKTENTTKYKGLNTYKVNFTQKNKYNPVTRSIEVLASNESAARYVVFNEFDSFRFNKELKAYLPTGRKITINSVEELTD